MSSSAYSERSARSNAPSALDSTASTNVSKEQASVATVANVDPVTGIYHEKQVKANCGLHCVNNLLQGPYFDENLFRMVARKLDQKEQELTGGKGLDRGNALRDGWFNVQVMEAVLLWAGFDMVPIKGWSGTCDIKEFAYILNRKSHWFALRQINQEWFELNSCSDRPRSHTEAEVRAHLRKVMREGYSVFAVRGKFPNCTADSMVSHATFGSSRRSRSKEADTRKLKERLRDALPAAASITVAFLTYFFSVKRFQHAHRFLAPGCRDCLTQSCLKWRGKSSDEDPPASNLDTNNGTLVLRGDDFDLDAICRQVAEREARANQTEHIQSEEPRRRKRWPLMVTLHVLILTVFVCAGLFVLSSQEHADLVSEPLGLESLLPRQTLLLVHTDCKDHRNEVWRWFTYQYTAKNLAQFLVQGMLLVMAGVSAEAFFGHVGVMLIYNVGIVAGGLGHLVADAHTAGMTDAIGGCACLLGVHIADFVMNWRDIEFPRLTLLSTCGMLLLLILHMDIIRPEASQEFFATELPITFAASGAGLIAGLSLGAAICTGPHGAWGLFLRGAVVLAGIFAVAISMFQVSHWPPRTFQDPSPWCWLRQVHNNTIFKDDNYHCVRCGDEDCIAWWSLQKSLESVESKVCKQVGEWGSANF